MYCTNCGNELNENSVHCPYCGSRAGEDHLDDWSSLTDHLTKGSLSFAKGLLSVLTGGMTLACIAAAVGCFLGGGYMLYFFASGSSVFVPSFLSHAVHAASLTSARLVFGGIAQLFIAVLFINIASALYKCMCRVNHTGHSAC